MSETESLGAALGSLCRPGDMIALSGELGAGKTSLARGILRGLGVRSHVQSPTFTIIREYLGDFPAYHFDVYRLDVPEDLEDAGYEEYFFPGSTGRPSGVVIVEWAEKVEALLPRDRMWVEISFEGGRGDEDTRRLVFTPSGVRYLEILRSLRPLVAGSGRQGAFE